MGLKAAIYTRVSTEEQRDYGYSIDGQIRELKDYCKRKKYDVVDIYNDAGFSGKNMNRPELERLLKDIKNGLIDVIVAIKVDRLTRDGYDGQWLLKECNKYNVILDLLYEQYDINTVNGEMMYGMNLLFAQRERKEIGNRTKRGLEEAVRQGKYPNKAPLGYIKNEDGFLTIDPVMSLVIKDIFELYLNGMSMNAIAKKFEKENRFNKQNTKWDEGKILKIINNPIYKGEIHWRRSTSKGIQNPMIIIPNHSPKIISEELYDKCQEQVNKNKHGGYGTHIHIFHSIVKCPYCKKYMSNYFTIKQRVSGPKEFYYVICKNPTCVGFGKIYNTEKIENHLAKLLNEITIDYKQDKYSLAFNYQEKSNELNTINKALDKLKKDEQKLLDLYLESSLNVETINKRNQMIQDEISKLEIKKTKLEENIIEKENYSIKEILDKKDKNKLLGIENIWSVLTREDKKKIINKYIKSIEITTYEKYEYGITNITFHNEFINNGINNLTDIALECIKESNKNITITPIKETESINNNTISILDDIDKSISDFQKFFWNIIRETTTLYPIYDLKNVLKDIKVEVKPV